MLPQAVGMCVIDSLCHKLTEQRHKLKPGAIPVLEQHGLGVRRLGV